MLTPRAPLSTQNGDPTQLYGQNQFCDATTDLRVGVDCANAGPPGLNLSCVVRASAPEPAAPARRRAREGLHLMRP